jgi:GH25 family lysozyme M1 (1,4-beta-N-acetylmuramidase)
MTALWAILGKPLVIDLSHNNPEPIDFATLYADGVRMVIHKATEGTHFVDPQYKLRRTRALAAGMKWEAYHFASSQAVAAQIDHFLTVADLDEKMRGAIDCEPNKGSTISFAQADDMAVAIDGKLGRQTLRYTGFGFLTPRAVRETRRFRDGPIWFAKYGPAPTRAQLASIGLTPESLVLWQETSTATRRGATGRIDESYWLGTAAELAAYPSLPVRI